MHNYLPLKTKMNLYLPLCLNLYYKHLGKIANIAIFYDVKLGPIFRKKTSQKFNFPRKNHDFFSKKSQFDARKSTV